MQARTPGLSLSLDMLVNSPKLFLSFVQSGISDLGTFAPLLTRHLANRTKLGPAAVGAACVNWNMSYCAIYGPAGTWFAYLVLRLPLRVIRSPIPVLLELRISGMKMAAKQAYFLFSSVLSTPMREEGCVGDGVT